MPALSSFDYAIVRVVPRVEREEFLNAGVILYCLTQRFLGARVALDPQRLRALSPDVDVSWCRATWSPSRACAPGQGSGPIGLLPQKALPLAGGPAQHHPADLAGALGAVRGPAGRAGLRCSRMVLRADERTRGEGTGGTSTPPRSPPTPGEWMGGASRRCRRRCRRRRGPRGRRGRSRRRRRWSGAGCSRWRSGSPPRGVQPRAVRAHEPAGQVQVDGDALVARAALEAHLALLLHREAGGEAEGLAVDLPVDDDRGLALGQVQQGRVPAGLLAEGTPILYSISS